MEQINRLIAHKLWLSSLKEENFISGTGEFESSYILTNDKQISRLNIIANVINKFESEDGNYKSLTIDDGSAQIRLKAWKEDTKILNNIKSGDLVIVIGKIRKYSNELYIIPEIVKKISPNEELLRKLELIKEYGLPKENLDITDKEQEIAYEEININSHNIRNKLLNLIEKYEDKHGITLEEIKLELHIDIGNLDKILEELIKEGQVYQINNKYRLLL